MNIRFIAWGGIVDKKLQLMGNRGKQAGPQHQQCQDQQSLSQLPLAPSQFPTSWELVTQQLHTSWELTEALKDLKTTILGGLVVHNYTDNEAISAPSSGLG